MTKSGSSTTTWKRGGIKTYIKKVEMTKRRMNNQKARVSNYLEKNLFLKQVGFLSSVLRFKRLEVVEIFKLTIYIVVGIRNFDILNCC